eukprot:scaffold75525_cov69-Phaeocystis_antarctica.AAC.6
MPYPPSAPPPSSPPSPCLPPPSPPPPLPPSPPPPPPSPPPYSPSPPPPSPVPVPPLLAQYPQPPPPAPSLATRAAGIAPTAALGVAATLGGCLILWLRGRGRTPRASRIARSPGGGRRKYGAMLGLPGSSQAGYISTEAPSSMAHEGK